MTKASIKLQTSTDDGIILYSRLNGYKDDLLSLSNDLEEKWLHATQLVWKLIDGQEEFYPILTRWNQEIEDFLKSKHSLAKYSNLITGQSLIGLHSNQYSYINATQDERLEDVKNEILTDFDLNISANGKAYIRRRDVHSIAKESAPNVISLQMGRSNLMRENNHIIEYLFQTTRTSEKDVLDDIFELPMFFRELALLLRGHKFLHPHGEGSILYSINREIDYIRSPELRMLPDKPCDISLERLVACLTPLSFIGAFGSVIGHHLALFRPSVYSPAPISAHLSEPKRFLEIFHYEDVIPYQQDLTISSSMISRNQLKKSIKESIHETNEKRLQAFSLAGLNPGPFTLDIRDKIHFNYGKEIVNALFSVANLKHRDWQSAIENHQLKKQFNQPELLSKRNVL